MSIWYHMDVYMEGGSPARTEDVRKALALLWEPFRDERGFADRTPAGSTSACWTAGGQDSLSCSNCPG